MVTPAQHDPRLPQVLSQAEPIRPVEPTNPNPPAPERGQPLTAPEILPQQPGQTVETRPATEPVISVAPESMPTVEQLLPQPHVGRVQEEITAAVLAETTSPSEVSPEQSETLRRRQAAIAHQVEQKDVKKLEELIG